MMKSSDTGDAVAAHTAEHRQVALLLPWYVNGTLDERESAHVDAHVADCLVCRRDLAMSQALGTAMSGRTREPRAQAALDRLHERIDAGGSRRRYFPWAAASVLVFLAGLAGVFGVNAGLLGGGDISKAYRTLGTRTLRAPEYRFVTARIVFRPGVTERQLRELLLAAGAELIDGPTQRGAYTIALPRIPRGEDLQTAVGSLRASRQVMFIEPIASVKASPLTD